MYPKRLILEEARRLDIPVLPLDINRSAIESRVERAGGWGGGRPAGRGRPAPPGTPPPGTRGIRLALADVKGISEAERERLVAGRPYAGLVDFWRRAGLSVDVAERLVLAGAFDELYGIGLPVPVGVRGVVTRRDLLLTLADLERERRADNRVNGRRARGLGSSAAPQQQAVQLALDFGGEVADPEPAEPDFAGPEVHGGRGRPGDVRVSGLPEMTPAERMAAELDIIGMDATRHVLSDHLEFLTAIGVTWSRELLERRARSSLLVAGVKVATQTPPVRSGRRVVFLTLDDTTGPVDLTFFEDAQGPYAATVFNSWLVLARGELRRTGPRGVSLRATGAWDLAHLHGVWRQVLDASGDAERAAAAVHAVIDAPVEMPAHDPGDAEWESGPTADPQAHGRAGGMGQRRVFLHPSGFVQSPYTDVAPAGPSAAAIPREFTDPGRKLWHSSPGSTGR
ncbi:helix-hairpin-helix domain-containing protein [Nigerium massiliense]